MNQQPEPLPPVVTLVEPPPAAPPVPRKGWARLSWVVILGFVGLIVGLRMVVTPGGGEAKESTLAARIDLKVMQVQMQCLVAARELSPTLNARDLYDSVASEADGDPAKRLRISVFAAEMVGPKEALDQLDAAAHPDERQARLIGVLRRLYHDHERGLFYHPSVNDADAQWLQEQLGWLGSLAIFPSMSETTLQQKADAAGVRGPALLEQYREGREEVLSQAQVRLFAGLAAVGAVGSVLLLGSVALPIFLLLWATGVVRVGLQPGIAHGGVYAETFALWLVLYGGLLIGGEMLLHDVVPAVVRGSIAMPLSLVVVFWPVLRGVPWRQVRQDIGWTAGRQPLLEPSCGWTCYLVNVPVMVAGFVVTIALAVGYARLQSEAGGGGEPAAPTHPILEQFAHPDAATLVLTFVFMSIIAPVVEETMFRGFLHRQLREVLFTRRPFLGGVCSALVVNLVFAVIHPQGLFFVPVLTALACGFSLAREWRGTLVPCMIAHGTHNFAQGLLAVLLLTQ